MLALIKGIDCKDGKSDMPHKSAFRSASNVRRYECTEIDTVKWSIGHSLSHILCHYCIIINLTLFADGVCGTGPVFFLRRARAIQPC